MQLMGNRWLPSNSSHLAATPDLQFSSECRNACLLYRAVPAAEDAPATSQHGKGGLQLCQHTSLRHHQALETDLILRHTLFKRFQYERSNKYARKNRDCRALWLTKASLWRIGTTEPCITQSGGSTGPASWGPTGSFGEHHHQPRDALSAEPGNCTAGALPHSPAQHGAERVLALLCK